MRSEKKHKVWQGRIRSEKAKLRGAGDAVALVAHPIVKGIDYVLGTNVQGCGGCGTRQEWLNESARATGVQPQASCGCGTLVVRFCCLRQSWMDREPRVLRGRGPSGGHSRGSHRCLIRMGGAGFPFSG